MNVCLLFLLFCFVVVLISVYNACGFVPSSVFGFTMIVKCLIGWSLKKVFRDGEVLEDAMREMWVGRYCAVFCWR